MEEENNHPRKTLHLNLKKKWFKMIFFGVKTEEYRDLSDHWVSRLFERTEKQFKKFPNKPTTSTYNFLKGYCGDRMTAVITGIELGLFKPKIFNTITFSNGYDTYRPQFEIEFKGIEIREGNPEWGAEPGKKYFVLKLGDILNDVNCARFIIENMEV